jgi:hypothetical protein
MRSNPHFYIVQNQRARADKALVANKQIRFVVVTLYPSQT